MKSGVLDANVLLRFFLQDDLKQSQAVTSFFNKAAGQDIDLILQDAIVAEVTFVMGKVYRRTRAQIADALLDFIQHPFIMQQSPGVLGDALLRYRAHPVDFPDALVAALAAAKGIPSVSFDRDLDRFPDVRRIEPKN